jgi:hypothetical protein
MVKHKCIYWRPDLHQNKEGELFANVHLLIGCNQGKIIDRQVMADEIRETFPQAELKNIFAGNIKLSSCFNGFHIASWNEHIPKQDYPGWQQSEQGMPEYSW